MENQLNKNFTLIPLVIALLISGCGGGSGDNSGNNSGDNSGNNSGDNSGDNSGNNPDGSLSNPKILVDGVTHNLTTNPFYNNFLFSGSSNTTLFLKANYELPFVMQQRIRCAANYSISPVFTLRDREANELVCTDSLILNYSDSKQDIISLPLSSRSNGKLLVAVVSGNSAITNPHGNVGTPTNPTTLQTSNNLNHDSFSNYFKYSAATATKIHLSVLLNSPLTSSQEGQCAASGGSGADRYSTGIRVYDDQYNLLKQVCGTDLEYELPSSGNYIINFNFEGAGNKSGQGLGIGTAYFESFS